MPGRPKPGQGRTSNTNVNMSWLGALAGGGGDNPAYKGADAAGSNMAKMQDYYENPEKYSAAPVSGKALTATYGDVNKYGIDNPFKPLNWLGRATGQADPYSQFRMQQGAADLNLGHDTTMEQIRFDHEKEIKAIENSNLTERQKSQALLESSLKKAEKEQAAAVEVTAKHGFIPNEANIGAVNAATSGMIPTLAPQMLQQGVDKQAADIAEANARAKALGYAHLGGGDVLMPYSNLSPGMSAMNLHPTPLEQSMGQATGKPVPSGLQLYDAQGDPVHIRARTNDLLGGQFKPGVTGTAPAAPLVPSAAPTMGPAVSTPSSIMGDWLLKNVLAPAFNSSAQTFVPGYGQPQETEEQKRKRMALTPQLNLNPYE